MKTPSQRPAVICVSSIDWDFIWQGHQEIMSRYAARGQKVLFIENTGVRTPRFRDGPRLWRRLKNWRRGWGGIREEAPNLFVFSPLVLPFPSSPLAVWCNGRLLLRGIQRWMKTLSIRETIFFTWLPTGLARRIVDEIDPLAAVYFCCDNFSVRSSQPGRIEKAESRLLEKTDLVLAHGIKIKQRLEKKHPRVELMQYGISASLFRKEHAVSPPSKEGPLVYGYVGGLHEHVDQDLLVALARKYPEVEIRLIGPEQCDVSRLRAEKNIRLLGQKPHQDLPVWMRQFDAGLIPYLRNSYTETVFPTKLTEYFGCGLPVVSTDIPEVTAFEERFPGSVECARNHQEFILALEPAKIRSAKTGSNRRKEVAWQNTWEGKIEILDRWLEECIKGEASKAAGRTWGPPIGWPGFMKKIWKPALVLGLTYLFLGTRLFWLGADLLLVPPKENIPADAVVVIGGGAGETGDAGVGYIEKSIRASRLVKEGQASVMLILSGATLFIEEGRLMRGVALEEGIPEREILLENLGGGTREMIRRAVEIARSKGWRSVTLVASPYHMARALRVWKKEAPAIPVQAEPHGESRFYDYQEGEKWWHRKRPSLVQIWGITKELVTRIYYRARRWS